MNPAPLAPKNPLVPGPVSGVKMATCSTGIKYADRHDLLMMVFDNSASVAGVFTKSKCSSAPVDWCRAALSTGGALVTGGALATGDALAAGADPAARAVIVNAGNANAFTGQKGEAAVKQTAKEAAQICNCDVGEVYLASTGVIGEPLDAGQLTEHFADLSNNLTDDGWQEAAQAIMTTDTYPKMASQKFDVEGQTIVINGIAKGSGMIAPDMATMLSFVVTDMPVAQPLLQSLLSQLVEGTFNAITVDSDTSTSDSLMLFATGAVEVPRLESTSDPRFASFKEALRLVLHDLAMQTVRDGEGATKQVEICVTGAEDERAAKKIALSIANSPLVKTAVAGEDANWGRVVMAVGKAGEAADRDALAISFGDVRVAVAGERDPAYSEEEASAVMRRDEITISVDVGIGNGSARVWTCDLTKEYVSINGDYRS